MKSKQEAIEWAKRAPAPHGEDQEGEIELRQLFELEDFEPGEAIERARELENNLPQGRRALAGACKERASAEG